MEDSAVDHLNFGSLTLTDLPVRENRDAWKLVRAQGRLFQLDNSIAATDRAVIETAFKNPGVFSSKQAFDILASPLGRSSEGERRRGPDQRGLVP